MAPCDVAPRPLPQSWPSPSPPPTIAHYMGTLQWHPAMAPHPLLQSWFPPTIAHYNGTLQCTTSTPPWSSPYPPTIAHYNGTLQCGTTSTPQSWPSPFPPNHSTLQWHPTMAPSNGTTSTAPCNGTLVSRPIRQSGSSPSPLLEVRTPIASAIWGKMLRNEAWCLSSFSSINTDVDWFNTTNKLSLVVIWSSSLPSGWSTPNKTGRPSAIGHRHQILQAAVDQILEFTSSESADFLPPSSLAP